MPYNATLIYLNGTLFNLTNYFNNGSLLNETIQQNHTFINGSIISFNSTLNSIINGTFLLNSSNLNFT